MKINFEIKPYKALIVKELQLADTLKEEIVFLITNEHSLKFLSQQVENRLPDGIIGLFKTKYYNSGMCLWYDPIAKRLLSGEYNYYKSDTPDLKLIAI